ncbi:MAG: phosphotransferase, partial [Alphaproteobacteria bacterium]|nr:phosphotransferase [Alphaproteobacteria bacterium]
MTLVGPVIGGLSGARLFRLGAEGRSWLLRLDAGGDMFRDPARWQPCMRIAAAAGLAPEVRYTDAQHGVSITAFVEGRTLAAGQQGPREAMISALGDLVRRLQATEPFPPLVDYMDGMAALLGQLRAGGLLAPDALEAELIGYAQLDTAYRALRPELASSHNDLNPRNILQDGARLWVVDWESAFL